ncbi:replication initiation and membrane attachment family protein [Mycoplasmopsis edwardii]|nr:hypothetical protein [Mycoplasmopsis edwardii]
MSKKLSLDFDHFAVTRAGIISNADLTNLRQLYGPIIGGLGVLLYEYLIDLSRNVEFATIPFNFSSLNILLNSHENDLNKSRAELEALGLINTYKDSNRAVTIFILQRPLTPEQFTTNPFLTKLLIKHVGKTNFERLTKRKESSKISVNPFEFEDISENFFNVFQNSLTDSSNNLKNFLISSGSKEVNDAEIHVMSKNNDIYTPLPIGNIKYTNIYQAVLNLDTIAFIKQCLNREPLINELENLETWKSIINDTKALNIIIFYAFKRRNQNWFKYTNNLIAELKSNKIFEFDKVENYLDGKFKNNLRTKKIYEEKTVLKAQYIK